ncbi:MULTISPECIES: SDR family oxidoreductase [Arthrobacter]|uniref:SDR family oxidoreductase n=2 Tax=Arthrobacter TaxID=1663 RepID=A0ABU9KLR2_9MICC|nr:SDR family oxidoreductase [Arthrobacter sp. YJM1]MDP5227506.1 SDR family oxidoreductase [Arthrobacter sp. YJM1]
MERYMDRVVFLTGAARGIGEATARRLFAEGASLALADRNTGGLDTLVRDLGAPDRLLPLSCDITDRVSVDAAVEATVARFGRLDCLVSVAGGSLPLQSILEGLDDDGWTAQLDQNLGGPMRCIRAAVPHLGRGGSIVLVGSVNGSQAWGGDAYSAAKAGLENLAKNLAVELGPAGVRINVVAPATTRTPYWDAQGGAGHLAVLYPLGRVGEPEDMAAAIAFLGSDDASWITGITLPVDGGGGAGPLHALKRLGTVGKQPSQDYPEPS